MRRSDRTSSIGTLAVLAVFSLLLSESRASNGVKPPAVGSRHFGRAGAGIAFVDDATSMHVNPALITEIPDENLSISPGLFLLDATYKDRRNSSKTSSSDPAFFINSGYVFDFDQTREELREEMEEARGESGLPPRFRDPVVPPSSRPRGWDGSAPLSLRVPIRFVPRTVEIIARGPGQVFDVSVTAEYRSGAGHSSILATSGARRDAGRGAFASVARLEGLRNRLPNSPDEIRVYYKVDVRSENPSDRVDVRVLLDGRDAGGSSTTAADEQGSFVPPPDRRETPRVPPAQTGEGKESPSWLKIGVGNVVLAGGGTDYDIATTLYPEGVQHFSDLSFLALTPTAGFRISDAVSIGATLQIDYGKQMSNTPLTLDSSILKGNLFPSGSLDAALGGSFGLPNEMGAAMKYAWNTSDSHAPGTSITHTAKPNDPAFTQITGTAEIKEADALGLSAKIGLLLTPVEKWKVGLTYQSKTKMENFVGKAHVDYNRQIEAFLANPTKGHSDEVRVLGIPNEIRFTFDEVWRQGVVDTYINNALAVDNFPLPGGPIVGSLPNGGVNGFANDYDLVIEGFELPPEIGIGTSYPILDWLTVMIDYRRIFWSQTFDAIHLDLRNGSNPDVNALVGSPHVEVEIPLDWEDQNVYALGFEIVAADWLSLRAGWSYGKNPVPEETALPVTSVYAEHHLSLGATVHFEGFAFDLSWAHAFEKSVNVGTSRHTSDLNGAEMGTAQDFILLGITHEY